MLFVFSLIFPLFAVIFCGYLAVLFKLFSLTAIRIMGKFVVLFAIPAMILEAILSKPLKEFLNFNYFCGYAFGSFFIWFLTYLINRIRKKSQIISIVGGLGTAVSNSGFMGYPIALIMIGSAATTYFTLNIVIENLIVLPLFFLLADFAFELEQENKKSKPEILLKIAFNLLRNPVIISIIIAVLLAIFNFGEKIPQAVFELLKVFKQSGVALSLFVIGGNLVGMNWKGNFKEMLQISLAKLLLHPLFCFLGVLLFGGSVEIAAGAALFASMPTFSLFTIFGTKYGCQKICAAAAISTTIGAIFTITVIGGFIKQFF